MSSNNFLSSFQINMEVNNSQINSTEQFEDKQFLTVMGMLAIFSVIGTTENAMVLCVYVRKRHKFAATVFIISLAATDFITCLIIVPYTIAVEYVDYVVHYDILCKLYMFFITSNVPFATFIMVAIAVDRYLCICHPLRHLMNAKRAKGITFILAGIAFTLGIVTSLNYSVYNVSTLNSCDVSDFPLVRNVSGSTLLNPSPIRSLHVLQMTKNVLRKEKHTRLSEDDATHVYRKCLRTRVEYTGKCQPSAILLSSGFVNTYQAVYASLFLVTLILVFVLYGLVFRSVLVRRATRRRKRRPTFSVSIRRESWFYENGPSLSSIFSRKKSVPDCNGRNSVDIVRQIPIREKGLLANIRTAAMLFAVTAVFTVVFLPAWLMAHNVIHYNIVIFYTYFFYNVANPIIYAFMNETFRRDLREMLGCKSINIKNKNCVY